LMSSRQAVAFLLAFRLECDRMANAICATADMPPLVLPIKEINQSNSELNKSNSEVNESGEHGHT
jgi:hypothetical protein